jgi:hypothetical protein
LFAFTKSWSQLAEKIEGIFAYDAVRAKNQRNRFRNWNQQSSGNRESPFPTSREVPLSLRVRVLAKYRTFCSLRLATTLHLHPASCATKTPSDAPISRFEEIPMFVPKDVLRRTLCLLMLPPAAAASSAAQTTP